MAERRKRLTEKLNEIDQQLQEGAPIASDVQAPLQEAIGKVREVAQSSSDDEQESETLGATLADLGLHLEVSHPRLTQLLNHLSEILAGTGF